MFNLHQRCVFSGVSAKCFVEAFSLCTPACVMHIATPGGKQPEYVDQDEASFRWLQDFRTKPFSTPLCLETIDGSRYDALLLPSAQGAMIDLASSQSLARIIRHFVSEQKPLCAVSHGVAALCCAVDEDKSWAFSGYSITGPTVFELVRRADFSTMQLIVEDFARDAGAVFSGNKTSGRCTRRDMHWRHISARFLVPTTSVWFLVPTASVWWTLNMWMFLCPGLI
uniref:Glutamine amidotransferase-like class 1 domain-containing protein 1 n=1 Tax=Eptatretus burgeri TaxID=7764 RepID=A0A8C4NA77_EPTBU